ncbi:MAG: DotU family type IV/VI secretion system protein [Candidatus Algichlamydia australiensis]|nr:DotU family type IV/VI secretion system protein [Chlamydiales bacterium]
MSSQYWPKISSCLEEIETERELIDHQEVQQEQVEMLKTKATKILESLKNFLHKNLNPSQSLLIEFALTSYINEQMQSFAHRQIKNNISWPPLQHTLGTHKAGEVFFKKCDSILEDRQTPLIVYEVYYFIIKRGFKGQYKDTQLQIDKYLDLLQERIGNAKIELKKSEELSPQKPQKFKPKHYYAAAAALSFLFLLILFAQSTLN